MLWPLIVRSESLEVATLAGHASRGGTDGPLAVATFAHPAGVAVAADGTVGICDFDGQTIRMVDAHGTVTTVAGRSGVQGYADGRGQDAQFNYPAGVCFDLQGNLYVADSGNHVIRRVGRDGRVETFAGTPGRAGVTDGPRGQARFQSPEALTIDKTGVLFIADTGNCLVRRIALDGSVTTVAGVPHVDGYRNGDHTVATFEFPGAIAVDASGVVYVSDNSTIRAISPTGQVSLAAGMADQGGYRDDSATNSQFNVPRGLAVDGRGRLWISDRDNNCIRVLDQGRVTTVAGGARSTGVLSEDGTGVAAHFLYPEGIAFRDEGTLLIADAGNNTVRALSTADGHVSTITGAGAYAGNNSSMGATDGSGLWARFNGPESVAIDPATNDVIIADTANHVVRRLRRDGTVVTLAGLAGSAGADDGAGSSARFDAPLGVAIDPQGRIYVSDSERHTIRRIESDGVVHTIAGAAGSPGFADANGTAARFNTPCGLAIDGVGDVLIADAGNHVIRRLAADGVVTTVAGGPCSNGDADGPAADARFDHPVAVAVDTLGNMFVADRDNGTVRKLDSAQRVTTYAGLPWRLRTLANAEQWIFNAPLGLAADQAGNVFVADLGGALSIIDRRGSVSFAAGNPRLPGSIDGIGAAAGIAATGLATDPTGDLYFAESSSNTIRVARRLTSTDARIINCSIRGTASIESDRLILGFVLCGSEVAKSLLVRGVGPSLRSFGVMDAATSAPLVLFHGSTSIAQNDTWSPHAETLVPLFAQVGAFPLVRGSADSAMTVSVPNGAYTTNIVLPDGTSGSVLSEVYELESNSASRLINISGRSRVDKANRMIVGFVVNATGPTRFVFRAVGGGLAQFGVANTSTHPTLELYSGSSELISRGLGWTGNARIAQTLARVGAFPTAAGEDNIVVSAVLQAGTYTAVIGDDSGKSGVALFEIYVPSTE